MSGRRPAVRAWRRSSGAAGDRAPAPPSRAALARGGLPASRLSGPKLQARTLTVPNPDLAIGTIDAHGTIRKLPKWEALERAGVNVTYKGKLKRGIYYCTVGEEIVSTDDFVIEPDDLPVKPKQRPSMMDLYVQAAQNTMK